MLSLECTKSQTPVSAQCEFPQKKNNNNASKTKQSF